MNRRESRKQEHASVADRAERIAKLIAGGWIRDAAEIPADSIPVDPDRINLGGSYFRPTHFSAVEFACADCGVSQRWEAEDQRWYYETTQAPYYSTAKRCRACRKREQARKRQARIDAGHDGHQR